MKKHFLTIFAISGVTFSIKAQVTYTDINPDVTIGMDQMYLLDMDGDSNNDYIIEQVDSVIGGNPLEGVQLRAVGTINEAVYENGSLTFLSAIPMCNLIDGVQNWTVPTPSLPAGGIIMVGSTPYPAGDWIDGQDHVAGLRFTTGANQYYGWVRFTVSTDGLSATIHDYAYESTPDQGLEAGICQNVGELMDAGFAFVQTNGIVQISNAYSVNNTIKVYSISGQLMKEVTMTENSITIDLNVLPFGIYLISCNGENGEALFKANNLK